MARILNVYNKKKINTGDYLNSLTGEQLSSEIPNISSLSVLDKEMKIIDSSEYIIFDSSALRHILPICSKADMEKILRMSDMVDGCYNVLHDKTGSVHSPKTLRLTLNYDESEFSRFMKRLESKSIICYRSVIKERRKYKTVMMNPTLCRKSKMFHKDCLSVFDNLSTIIVNANNVVMSL